MNEKQLQEIEARRNATTLGKWLLFAKGTTIEVQVKDAAPVVSWSGFDDCSRALAEHFANAKFIVCAHNNDIDALISEVRRLQAVVDFYANKGNWTQSGFETASGKSYNDLWTKSEHGYTIAEACLREDGE